MNLRDRLARLTLSQATKSLGPRGPALMKRGAAWDLDPSRARVSANVLRLTLPEANVSLIEDHSAPAGFRSHCSACDSVCEHVAAALTLILEEKTALGLARKARDEVGVSELNEEELVKRELLRRADRAGNEPMRVKPMGAHRLWDDFVVTSQASGKTYRVAIRGLERGESYCSCPDFRKNTLGTCKHIMRVLPQVKKRLGSVRRPAPYRPDRITVHLSYGAAVELRVQFPSGIGPHERRLLRPFAEGPVTDAEALAKALARCAARGADMVVYPDAEEYLSLALHRARLASLVADIRRDPAAHALRKTLLAAELLPYQLDGIAFAAGTGRAVLADDMGLGKTIQAVGTAELLARECDIQRTLVVCPASVKAQWVGEIKRFCSRSAQIVAGSGRERSEQYHSDAFFTVCNYEQVLRDLRYIEQVEWDFIVLDEGQRIKNWQARTSKTLKALRSRYALVLSGTPLENRLEELYSVVEFIDDRRLGPDFRFEHRHRIAGPTGRTEGYHRLDQLRESIKPVLLRRTRAQVMSQLPPRTTEIVRVTATEEQLEIHRGGVRTVTQIVNKHHLTEMDLLRLQKALLLCRMSADSTTLVDKLMPGYSSKLERLALLLPQLAQEPDRKVIVFSEWTGMLSLIEKRILAPARLGFVRLDGSVPQRNRAALVRTFQSDPHCMFFTATNAGATGLNLQVANTVVNVDLPWNPAILEQRVGRAHRMGQRRPVQVYLMVTEGTIEENMLRTLAAKQDLSLAALDSDSDVTRVDLRTGVDNLKRRLEVLLAPSAPAPEDRSEAVRVEQEASRLAQRSRVEQAGGQMVSAAFSLLQAMLPSGAAEPDPEVSTGVRTALESCLERDKETGDTFLRVRLPGPEALDALAGAVAALVAAGNRKGAVVGG